jgi:hypothetical protein
VLVAVAYMLVPPVFSTIDYLAKVFLGVVNELLLSAHLMILLMSIPDPALSAAVSLAVFPLPGSLLEHLVALGIMRDSLAGKRTLMIDHSLT